jgi:hypothetical protein
MVSRIGCNYCSATRFSVDKPRGRSRAYANFSITSSVETIIAFHRCAEFVFIGLVEIVG